MGIFYTAPQPVLPTIQAAIHNALVAAPPAANQAAQEAAARTVNVAQQMTPTFNAWRFGGAVLISIGLLIVAILTDKSHLDISKA